MANAIPIHSPMADKTVVAGLMAPGTDEVVPPTNFLADGKLVDKGDIREGEGKASTPEVVVPLNEGNPYGTLVLTHKAYRMDH